MSDLIRFWSPCKSPSGAKARVLGGRNGTTGVVPFHMRFQVVLMLEVYRFQEFQMGLHY